MRLTPRNGYARIGDAAMLLTTHGVGELSALSGVHGFAVWGSQMGLMRALLP